MDSSTKAKKREEFLAVVRRIGPLPTSALAAGEPPREGYLSELITKARKQAMRTALAAIEGALATSSHRKAHEGKSIHVLPRPEGGWEVKVEGGLSALVVTPTQEEAVKVARAAITRVLAAMSNGEGRHGDEIYWLWLRHPRWEVKVEDDLSAIVVTTTRQEAVKVARVAIAKVLAARQVKLTRAARAQLDECADPEILRRWHDRAFLAATETDVFSL
ncbi:MAG TPA: DUF2188 domain-containing protein [Polyangiaceae bacterium]|nr:DUF2188 domain-containing protein [Polyangiaceae bacterium]